MTLTKVKGIGRKTEELLNTNGIKTITQLAGMNPEHLVAIGIPIKQAVSFVMDAKNFVPITKRDALKITSTEQSGVNLKAKKEEPVAEIVQTEAPKDVKLDENGHPIVQPWERLVVPTTEHTIKFQEYEDYHVNKIEEFDLTNMVVK